MDSAYRRFSENIPGSQPTEIILTLFPAFAAASTFAKYSGIFACVSKLSIVQKFLATSGPITGRSVAEPPHRTITSISSFIDTISSKCFTSAPSVLIETVFGSLLVNTAFSSISSLRAIACSTPRPIFPYPTIPILIFSTILSPFPHFIYPHPWDNLIGDGAFRENPRPQLNINRFQHLPAYLFLVIQVPDCHWRLLHRVTFLQIIRLQVLPVLSLQVP